MIKYFIRQYWRYIAMGLAMLTISYFIGACEVKAEGNYISPAQLTFKNFPSNTVYNATNCSNDTCYWEFDDRSRGGVFRNYNTTHSFTGVTLVLVNGSLVSDDGNNSIMSINFLGNPCYFTQSVYYSNDTYSNNTQNHNFSAYCPISNTDNIGTLTISPYQELVEINMSNGVYVDKYMLSKIKIVQDTWGTELLRVLYQNNGYWATNEAIQLQIKSLLEQNLSKQDITNGYLNTFQGYLQRYENKIDELLEQNQVCRYIDKSNVKDRGFLTNTGGIGIDTGSDEGVTDYIQISKTAKIKILTTNTDGNRRYCFYNINKEVISCSPSTGMTVNTYLTIPQNSAFVRFTILKTTNKPTFEICDTSQNITNQQNEQIIQGNNDINNSINDSSTDDPSSDLSDMQQNEISNNVISDLLLLPVTLFQNIVNSINGTCSSFNLGALYGSDLILPCINISSLIGSNLWGVIDILFCGIFILTMRKKFVDIFENITSLKDRGNELE